jgi:hypothetical protein
MLFDLLDNVLWRDGVWNSDFLPTAAPWLFVERRAGGWQC